MTTDRNFIVEVGWTVDDSLNGDYRPHLFVYHWVNNGETCYNGCGFVQVKSPYSPGMALRRGCQAAGRCTRRWTASPFGATQSWSARKSSMAGSAARTG
jgi:hypothetical protein